MKYLKNTTVATIFVTISLLFPAVAKAQPCPPNCQNLPPGFLNNPSLSPFLQNLLFPIVGRSTAVEYLRLIIPNLLTLILIVGAIVFVFMLLISGIQWKEQLKRLNKV